MSKPLYTSTIILFYFALFFFPLKTEAQQKNFIDQPYLETTAKVDTLVVPDRIYLNILLTEADTKGRISVEELENRMATQLKRLGIDLDTQLSLADLESDFRKYFLRKTDIQKEKAFILLVYDGLTVGKVLQGLESIGISNINLNRTEYSQMETLKLELKVRAIVRARELASTLVKAIDQNLGKALHVQDFEPTFINLREMSPLMMKADAAASEPLDVAFNKIKVEGRINVKFAIE